MNQKPKIDLLEGEPPWDLLLTADPSREQIQAYLKDGTCYQASLEEQVIGVFVLLDQSEDIAELMNIAIAEGFRGRGFGKILIQEAIAVARGSGMKQLEVGTGNSSLDQLAFYQKAGFRIVGVDRGFFRRNYKEEIVENGIRCLDMIRLSMDL